VGDAVLALPAVSAVCEAFPERSVVVVARRVVAPLFVGLAGVTEVVQVARRGPARLSGMARALSGERPALAIVMPPSFGAAAEMAVTRPRQSWGYGGPLRRLALDVTLPRRWVAGRHRWEAYALLAAAATGRPVPERYPLAIGPGDVTAADKLFAELDGTLPVVGLVPGSYASSRRWPVEHFAALASALGRDGARVVLFGAPGDAPRNAAIAALSDPAPADWSGRDTLPILAECFRRIDLLVTNDTGPMHLAAAMGTPLIVVWGAADPRITGPRAGEVFVHSIHCWPCVKNTCAYNLGCMTGISIEAVLEHARARLGRAWGEIGGAGATVR
jgi:lipopolysaccharide heptosyltransferase II